MNHAARSAVDESGCRFWYSIEGAGPPVVFIQGVGVHGRGWTPQVDELRSSFECLIFDNRGMGESLPARVPITVEQMARDTLWLMDEVGWGSAHVVGHSLGGPVALEIARTAPARVRSLSLLCTIARGSDATRLTWQIVWLGLRGRIGSRRSRRRAFLKIVMPSAVLDVIDQNSLAEELAPVFGHDLAIQPPIAMKQLSALRAYDARSNLAEFRRIPTLVMSAAHDIIAPPRFGRALADAIPGARYVEFEEAAHGLPIQYAANVNALLREHFAVADSAR